MILSGVTLPCQRGPGSNGNYKLLDILPKSKSYSLVIRRFNVLSMTVVGVVLFLFRDAVFVF